MRSILFIAVSLLGLNGSIVMAVDLDKLPNFGDMTKKPLLENVNKSLTDQQIKDGQFEFKTGKAEFAGGNEKRVSGLMKILTENSKMLKTAFPALRVVAEGHTDAEGGAAANQKLSLARAKTVCAALKGKGIELPCKATRAGRSKPLVSPEETAGDTQKNRRVLVHLAK